MQLEIDSKVSRRLLERFDSVTFTFLHLNDNTHEKAYTVELEVMHWLILFE